MKQKPTEDEVLGYFQSCSNWGRWGRDDQRGTMNYITAEKRKQAFGLVREGHTVSCSRPIRMGLSPEVYGGSSYRLMNRSGESHALEKKSGAIAAGRASCLHFASEVLVLNFHGLTTTHMDALSHVCWDGTLYNGHPAESVTTSDGATLASIDVLKEGVATRGVLLDVARTKGVKWMERGEGVFPEDLEETERREGVRVSSGDALLVRTGDQLRRTEEGPVVNLMKKGQPGYHAASLPWLHAREVALLTSDTANDVNPSGYRKVLSPIHAVAHVAMGLWLLDNSDLEALAKACEERGRWEFLFLALPLRVEGGTGCPINPVAVF